MEDPRKMLKRFLEWCGVQEYTDLNPEEKQTYNQWSDILGKDLTIADITAFIGEQRSKLAVEMRDAVKAGNDRAALLLAARIENYEDLEAVIKAPANAKQDIINHIARLLETPKA